MTDSVVNELIGSRRGKPGRGLGSRSGEPGEGEALRPGDRKSVV